MGAAQGVPTPPVTTVTASSRVQASTPFNASGPGGYTVDYDNARDAGGRVFLTHAIPGDGRNGAPNQRIILTWADLLSLQAAINDLVTKVTAALPTGQTP